MIRSWKRIFAVVLTAAMALSLLPMAALAATPADGSRAGAVIIDSANVTFRNFSMDYASPSVVDVTVLSVDRTENSAILYVPPAYTYEIEGTSIRWTVEGVDYVTKDASGNTVDAIVDAGDYDYKVTATANGWPDGANKGQGTSGKGSFMDSAASAETTVTLDHADGNYRDIIGGVLCNTMNLCPIFLYNV